MFCGYCFARRRLVRLVWFPASDLWCCPRHGPQLTVDEFLSARTEA
jgi:hypothetical protein